LEPIVVTLDGSEVSGHSGMTILELATEVGIEIPTLCYDSHLSPLGACRICLVEEETSGKLLASCVTPIAPGMVINTRSERVLKNRRTVVEMMLASHPDSCIVCDKGNRCKLRQIAADLGLGLISMEKIPTYHPMVELNPFIQRDLSKCIRCGRCVRACQEIAVVGAVDYTDRGFEARPATYLDAPLELTECNFCGICVSMCPTGALSERNRASTLTASSATRTVCTLCGTGCQILMEHGNDRVLGVRPAQVERSVNHVSLCVKGHYGMDYVNSGERLKEPLIRKNGELQPASWEEALDLVASKLAELKQKRGGAALGAIGASRGTNEENYLLQKFVRAVLGSNNIDSGARLRGVALASGIEKVLGYGATTNPISHIREAREILLVGADPLSSSPIVGQLIKQAVKFGGAHLTLVDPLPRGLEIFTGTWIHPKPGTQTALLAGMLRHMAAAGRLCSDDTVLKAESLGHLWHGIEPFTPERVEEITGVPAKLLTQTADRLAEAERLAIIPGSYLAGEKDAGTSGSLLAAMALLTGNIGRHGCGLFPIAGSLNDQGALDMGACPNRLPGYTDASDPEAISRFENAWGVDLPREAGLDCISMIEAAGRGGIAGMVVVGENPAGDCPEPSRAAEALSGLDLLVVQDLFLTETASLADVVFPASSVAEKDGTVTNLERRVQSVCRAFEPIGESRPDWRILLDLMARMGMDSPHESPADILQEINEMVPFYGGITLQRLDREKEGIFWPCADANDLGTAVLYQDGIAPEAADIALEIPDSSAPEPGEQYPIWLLSHETLQRCVDGVRTDHSRVLARTANNGRLQMNPFDAGLLGIEDGGAAVVSSPAGSLQTRIALSTEIPRGIAVAASLESKSLGVLFAIGDRDPATGVPHRSRIAVRVEALHGSK